MPSTPRVLFISTTPCRSVVPETSAFPFTSRLALISASVPLTVKLPVKVELTPTFKFPEIVVSSPVPLPKKLSDLVFN